MILGGRSHQDAAQARTAELYVLELSSYQLETTDSLELARRRC